MITCITHKKVFLTLRQAEDALVDARIKYNYQNHLGPVGVYHCDECGYFHLTSKGIMNDTLKNHMDSGKLKLDKEAAHWLSKLKKR